MSASGGPHPLLLAALTATALAALAASCNALWGVDELTFGQDGTTTTGTTTTTGSGGSAGQGTTDTGGDGGQGGCTLGGCGECLPASCPVNACPVEQEACLATAECTAVMSCMATCRWDDADCQSACLKDHPGAAASYYQWHECAACPTTSCNPTCANWCRPGCETDAGCSACINDDCAANACQGPVQTCAASGVCSEMSACVTGCQGDELCASACATSNPVGAVVYNDVLRCLLCTKAACWDVCAPESPSCEGY